MTSALRTCAVAAAVCGLLVPSLWAAKPAKPVGDQVELFAAMKSGDLAVTVIPKSEKEVNLLFESKTGKPLTVKLPEAFAAVPVLAQFGGGGAGGGGGGRSGGGGNQGMGGGMMGGGGMGGGGMGGGGGFFNVPAEKVAQMKVATVCLEHGKKEPRPGIPYEIVPLESFTQSAEVAELLKLFSLHNLSQRAVQAAAWHYNNGMSWQELAAKRIEHLNGTSEPYFSAAEINAAMTIGQATEARVKQLKDQKPTSSASTSLSQK